MCVIIDRPPGVPIDKDILHSAITDNDDGWGWMYSDGRGIVADWGLDTEDFYESYGSIPEDEHVTLHFRWCTHGEVSVNNCHPFLLHNGEYGLVHNGIVKVDIVAQEMSDTWHYAYGTLQDTLKLHGRSFASGRKGRRMRKILERNIGSANKMVILRSDGERMFLNREYGVEHKGLWLSNRGPLTPPLKGYTRYGRGGWADWDDVGEDGWYWDAALGRYAHTSEWFEDVEDEDTETDRTLPVIDLPSEDDSEGVKVAHWNEMLAEVRRARQREDEEELALIAQYADGAFTKRMARG